MRHVGAARQVWRRVRRLAQRLEDRVSSVTSGRSAGARILALLAFRNEMRYLPGFFENVAPQVDGIVALDDGSTDGSGEFVSGQPSIVAVAHLPSHEPHQWDENRSHRLLVQAAWPYQPDWLIAVDADERLERTFRSRADREIARARKRGYLAYAVVLRELWNAPDTYRADGIWGHKRVARFFQSRLDHEFDPRPLHGHWAPLNSMHRGSYPEADLVIYHLRMIEEQDRRARHALHTAADPDCRWQAFGYDYMIQERGLTLKPLPRRRDYHPLGR